MKIILSIKPEYANKILDGTKKFEFRKAGFAAGVESALIYATKPIGKVIGEFKITEVHIDAPNNIWNKTKKYAGVKKCFFDEYYRDRAVAVAIGVGEVHRYDIPKDLTAFGARMTAPQSFRYLPSETGEEMQTSLALV
jgi:predicted transcriptional regulator